MKPETYNRKIKVLGYITNELILYILQATAVKKDGT